MKAVVKLFRQQRGLFGAGKVADSLVTDNVWVIKDAQLRLRGKLLKLSNSSELMEMSILNFFACILDSIDFHLNNNAVRSSTKLSTSRSCSMDVWLQLRVAIFPLFACKKGANHLQ